MAWPLSDTFTAANGTTIQSHALDSGDSWAAHPQGSGGGRIQNNKFAQDVFLFALYTVTTAPSSADYEVSADFTGVTSQQSGGLVARMDGTARTGYELHITTGTGWTIYRLNAGAATSLASGSVSLGNGVTKTYKLRVSGSTITAYENGVQLGTHTDTSPITATGYAGAFLYSTPSPTIDNFAAAVLATPSAPARRHRPRSLYTR